MESVPTVYRNRISQKAIWEKEHGDRMEYVDWLLGAICEAFGFPTQARYQFAPDDRLREIYRSRYPRWKFWELGDSLELETLAIESKKHLGTTDRELLTLTLGEVVMQATSLNDERNNA